jgi:hypothetical protein
MSLSAKRRSKLAGSPTWFWSPNRRSMFRQLSAFDWFLLFCGVLAAAAFVVGRRYGEVFSLPPVL